MDKINVEQMLAIEEPFMKVPLEQLKRAVRQSQKQAERDTKDVSSTVNSLIKRSGSAEAGDIEGALDGMIDRLKTLKRKLEVVKQEEALLIQRSKQRAMQLNELSTFTSSTQPEFERWCRTRLDRVLIDYMLRSGHTSTAQQLIDSNGLEHFADSSLFTL
ncbi:GID complex subunit containing RING finger motif, partial [Linderina pennispora]